MDALWIYKIIIQTSKTSVKQTFLCSLEITECFYCCLGLECWFWHLSFVYMILRWMDAFNSGWRMNLNFSLWWINVPPNCFIRNLFILCQWKSGSICIYVRDKGLIITSRREVPVTNWQKKSFTHDFSTNSIETRVNESKYVLVKFCVKLLFQL